MGQAERTVTAAKAERDQARAKLDGRLDGIRGALNQRSIPSRAAHEVSTRVRSGATEAAQIIGEYRWVAGITALALFGWLLRAPLLRWGKRAFHWARTGEPQSPWQRMWEWTARKVTL